MRAPAHAGTLLILGWPSVCCIYDTFGDEIANELVEWFNAVDATYKADLRELNELNFQRFDAKLEQRVAQLDAKLERRLGELQTSLMRWTFMLWAPSALALIGLYFK